MTGSVSPAFFAASRTPCNSAEEAMTRSSSLDKATQAPLGMPTSNFEMSLTTRMADPPAHNKDTRDNRDSISGKLKAKWAMRQKAGRARAPAWLPPREAL